MTHLAALPPLQPPSAHDLIGLIPILIVAGAFVVLLMADLFTPASKRTWLAGLAVVSMAAALIASVLQWSDASPGHTVYYGA